MQIDFIASIWRCLGKFEGFVRLAKQQMSVNTLVSDFEAPANLL